MTGLTNIDEHKSKFELYFPSSSVSALCNRHPYRDSKVELLKVLKAYNFKYFKILHEAWVETNEVDKPNVEFVLEQFPDLVSEINSSQNYHEQYSALCKIEKVSNLLENLQSESIDTDKTVETKSEKIVQQYETEFKQKSQAIVNKMTLSEQPNLDILKDIPAIFQQEIIKERGVVQEKNAINDLKTKFGSLNVRYDNTHVFKKIINETFELKIGARIDAYLYNQENKIGVFEIKTRKNGWFGWDKLIKQNYDADQLACYHFVLDLPCNYLCEYYNGQLQVHEFTKEDIATRWNILRNELELVCQTVQKMVNSPFDYVSIVKKFNES